MAGIRIGELLVEQGVLTDRQVRHILKVQKISNRPFGDLAERLYGIDAKAVENAWVEQYIRTVGTVELDDQRMETDCLRLLQRRQAWQFQLLPMHREDHELHAATTRENLVRAVNFSSRSIDEPIYMMIAERRQFREFLMRHYPVPEHIARYAGEMEAAREAR